MPVNRLKEFLNENHVKFVTISHSRAYTAQEIAAVAHVPGKELAKTVMVTLDGELAMAVLPAPDQVSTSRLKKVTGASKVEVASEADFEDRFPGCEVGAMPPFGNLWDLQVFVDQRLREDEEIAFNAGSHTELIKLAYADFERMVSPVVAELSTRS
ncbi:MAG: YbaK/EbsC family protein [Gemmatimonadota bacterium]|nr:YbaK/EbsC family protein [Gemmatimonadota bacterium]MDH3423912.1 YbaK/EbsC family protein [Gemmatimonadota bacterium]